MSVTLTLTDDEMGTLWGILEDGSEPITLETEFAILRDHGPGTLVMHRLNLEDRVALCDEVMRQWLEQEEGV